MILCFFRGATNATIAAAGSNDSIYASLNLKAVQLKLGLVLTISLTASSTTIKGGSGADSINVGTAVSSCSLRQSGR